MSTDDPTPRIPEIFEAIDTGTASDPSLPRDESARVTVDGEPVELAAGATVLDAIQKVKPDSLPALCQYDHPDIGPRSECRTCVVGTDSHGIVPSCSYPAKDGMAVQIDDPRAVEARSVNLDLVLGNHNLRCTTCGKNGRCELQDTAIDEAVETPRYGVFDDRSAYEPIDDTSSFIQIDRNKCILCNRCVEACNDIQVEGVLRMEGSGADTRIGFQSGAETMEESTCVSCGHCVTVCPTGALVEKGFEDATTIPLPGFTQKNSVGSVIEASDRRRRPVTPAKRDELAKSTDELDSGTGSPDQGHAGDGEDGVPDVDPWGGGA